jgi:hypothetical protein
MSHLQIGGKKKEKDEKKLRKETHWRPLMAKADEQGDCNFAHWHHPTQKATQYHGCWASQPKDTRHPYPRLPLHHSSPFHSLRSPWVAAWHLTPRRFSQRIIRKPCSFNLRLFRRSTG